MIIVFLFFHTHLPLLFFGFFFCHLKCLLNVVCFTSTGFFTSVKLLLLFLFSSVFFCALKTFLSHKNIWPFTRFFFSYRISFNIQATADCHCKLFAPHIFVYRSCLHFTILESNKESKIKPQTIFQQTQTSWQKKKKIVFCQKKWMHSIIIKTRHL